MIFTVTMQQSNNVTMSSPFVFILFGATGDLARNKLFPALFSLFQKKQLGERFYIVGFARRPFSDEEFRTFVQQQLHFNDTYHQSDWEAFAENIYYQQGSFEERVGYEHLIERLNSFDKTIGACITRIFYLATPPNNYETILQMLTDTKLSEGCGQGSSKWTRLAIEKPFGKDLETAKTLDKKLAEMFEEKQIFRVDHYLGKETVQNMIAFRFANGIFEPVWNKTFVDHVQITWAEQKGIGARGSFFDGVGILRDVAQNHLMQLAATVVMEQPSGFSKEAIRDARAKAIASIRCPDKPSTEIVRGQYRGYLEEKGITQESQTETFVAMKTFFDTPRFEGVPFYLRAGKKMAKNVVEISIVFKQTCHILFKEYGCPETGNVLTIRIQPDEGIRLRVIAKKPGTKLALDTVDMKFAYKDSFKDSGADAYEKLLTDILSGDQMLFNRSDELQSSWGFITEVLTSWKNNQFPLYVYEVGTWGPEEAVKLIEKDNRKWL